MKYKIRQENISYSKLKAKERRKRLWTIENDLYAEAPTQENIVNLEALKAEYEREYDYIVRSSIIRSRATWFEQGERNTKYFLNLEIVTFLNGIIKSLFLNKLFIIPFKKVAIFQVQKILCVPFSLFEPRALDLYSGGPGFKSSSLPMNGFVFGGPEFNSSMPCK